jgi:riboflavin kinase
MLIRGAFESPAMQETTADVGHDEVAVAKLLAMDGAITGEAKTSCTSLADRLDASTQTASRRLQRLETAGWVTRETVSDGQWVAITDAGERGLRSEYEDYRTIFEGQRSVSLDGRVTSGMGEGRHYITLSGYMAQFTDRLGYEPYPGTLNVDLTDASVRRRHALDAMDPVPIDGWEDDDRTYGPAVCYPATIETADGDVYDDAHTIAPERTHHDDDQLELIAPDKLRDVLDLADDDQVTVTVEDDQ